MTVIDIGLDNLQLVGDDEECPAPGLGCVGGAAPVVDITPNLVVLIENEAVQANVHSSHLIKVEFH